MTREGLFKQSLIQFFAWLILYLGISKLTWFDERMQDRLVIFLIAILSYLLSLITLFFRPISLELTQKDYNHNNLEHMGIVIEKSSITIKQVDRIISVNLYIRRKKSVWWGLLLKSMRNFKVYVNFQLTFPALTLTPTTLNNSCEINDEYGFDINLNEHLKKLSEGNKEYAISEKYCYYPSFTEEENSDHLLSEIQYLVIPKLIIEVINPSLLNVFYSKVLELLIKFKTNQFTFNIRQR